MNNDALITIVNDFLNSSDDSDSESDADIDELLLLNMNRIIRGKRPRLQHYIDVIASYDDQEFKSNFRLHRDTCDYILDLIRADLEKWPQYFGKYPISANRQLYIALWMLANPDSYRRKRSFTGLLGDAAYTIQRHVIVPYKDNGHLTASEIHFNKKLSSVRMLIERAIALLKGRWRCLLDKLPMTRTDLIPRYIIACCVLHNICLLKRDEIKIPILIQDPRNDMLEELHPLDVNNEDRNGGRLKRRNLTHRFRE
ncbi:hypothetical protein ALC62_05719 [Cyphomyrmex costatus]|uniref:DDE Tnp4 domain-containing protein n=1 Tax=Cyphomyrmex costatus TaxID=456900 RepID=A0A151IJG2_9HYME|nr:hypothetical protein ALC62_05719 [Cyphomyrmex costatus]